MTFSNVSGQPIDGYMYTLQQQLAALGGFRIQYVPFPNANGDTDAATCCTATMFQSVLKHVDVVANDVYNDSPTLRSSGTCGGRDHLVLPSTHNLSPVCHLPFDRARFRQPGDRLVADTRHGVHHERRRT